MCEGEEAGKWIAHFPPIIECEQKFLLNGIDGPYHAQVAIEDIKVVVILELQHTVTWAVCSVSGSRFCQAFTPGVESLLEQQVQGTDTCITPVHRGEYMDVMGTIPPARWNASGDEVHHQLRCLCWTLSREEEAVPDVTAEA